MADANWWLMALAVALGLVLTLASMLRRVPSEGPASVPHSGATGVAGGRSSAESGTSTTATDQPPTQKEPDDGE